LGGPACPVLVLEVTATLEEVGAPRAAWRGFKLRQVVTEHAERDRHFNLPRGGLEEGAWRRPRHGVVDAHVARDIEGHADVFLETAHDVSRGVSNVEEQHRSAAVDLEI